MRKAKALPPNGLLEQLEPSHRKSYCLMGEPLLFETNDDALLSAADDVFGRYQDACPAEGDPLVVRLLVHESAVSLDLPRRAVYRTQGHLLSLILTPFDSAVVDLERGFAFGIIRPQLARDERRVRDQLITTLALAMLGPARQFFPLHAACVVRSGLSFLLAGPSGVGKSTLAMACARRGYQVVSEDVVHIGTRAHPLKVWGMPWHFQLLPDSVRFFPELGDLTPRAQTNGEEKLELDLEALLPGSTRLFAPPGPILLLERGERPRIEPLPRGDLGERLEPVWSWQMGWRAEMEQVFEHLLTFGLYRFVLSNTPGESAELLDEFVRELEAGHVRP